jgi:hypothetical protein
VSYLKADAGVARRHKVEQLLGVFAHEGLEVVAGDVVPLEAVVVEVVEDGKARLVVALGGLTVVGLRLVEAAGAGPVAGVALAGGADLGARAGPEPSVHVGGLQVGTVAAIEVALAARGPDVPRMQISINFFKFMGSFWKR